MVTIHQLTALTDSILFIPWLDAQSQVSLPLSGIHSWCLSRFRHREPAIKHNGEHRHLDPEDQGVQDKSEEERCQWITLVEPDSLSRMDEA